MCTHNIHFWGEQRKISTFWLKKKSSFNIRSYNINSHILTSKDLSDLSYISVFRGPKSHQTSSVHDSQHSLSLSTKVGHCDILLQNLTLVNGFGPPNLGFLRSDSHQANNFIISP